MSRPATPLGNVLITGGASGLGAATVEAVRAAGGVPLVVDRNKPETDDPWEYADLAYAEDAELPWSSR